MHKDNCRRCTRVVDVGQTSCKALLDAVLTLEQPVQRVVEVVLVGVRSVALAERYERRTVMISSNLVFSQWDRIFKDPMTTAAAIDRVVHHAIIRIDRSASSRQRAPGISRRSPFRK